MKNKSLILVIMIMLFTCGCSADVTLNIDENTVKEEVNITAVADGNNTKEKLKVAFRKYMPAFNDVIIADTEPDEPLRRVKYYTQDVKELDNGYLFRYSYDFLIKDYNSARSVKSAFESGFIEKNKEEQTLTLYTDKNGLIYLKDYNNLDSVTIKVKTDLKVLENNADDIKGNVYYWYFSKANNSKNIYFKMSTKKESKKKEEQSNKEKKNKEEKEDIVDDKYKILFAIGGIILFLVIVVILVKVNGLKYK